jgi:hypothetical protein
MDLRARLVEIADRGGSAQAEQACKLLESLDDQPAPEVVTAKANDLIEAYLHDPYLTKNEAH